MLKRMNFSMNFIALVVVFLSVLLPTDSLDGNVDSKNAEVSNSEVSTARIDSASSERHSKDVTETLPSTIALPSENDHALQNGVSNPTARKTARGIQDDFDAEMNAYKQYEFPFPSTCFSYDLKPSVFSSHLTADDLHRLKKCIKDKLSRDKLVIMQECSGLIISHFDSEYERPFFVWKYDSIKNATSRLLEGQEVTLKSDIFKAFDWLNQTKYVRPINALKFTRIGLKFKLANESLQAEFDKNLQDFKVTMRHSGDSYYIYDGESYVFHTEPLDIVYSIAQNDYGDPLYKNAGYGKRYGDSEYGVLSPYTTWTIKLSHMKGGDFSVFDKYKTQGVDIKLEGIGTYVDDNGCSDNLKYYEEYIFNETST